MSELQRFEISVSHTVYDAIDGELVIINMESGSYYSLDQVGLEIWKLIEQKTPVVEIVRSLSQLYEGDSDQIGVGVSQLLAQLQEEQLITPSIVSATPGASAPTEPGGEKPQFTSPKLQVFTDMKDFLLVDPIHGIYEGDLLKDKNGPSAE